MRKIKMQLMMKKNSMSNCDEIVEFKGIETQSVNKAYKFLTEQPQYFVQCYGNRWPAYLLVDGEIYNFGSIELEWLIETIWSQRR